VQSYSEKNEKKGYRTRVFKNIEWAGGEMGSPHHFRYLSITRSLTLELLTGLNLGAVTLLF